MKKPLKSRPLRVVSWTEPPRSFAPFLLARTDLGRVIGPAQGAASPTFNAEPPVSVALSLPLVPLPATRWAGTERMVMVRRR